MTVLTAEAALGRDPRRIRLNDCEVIMVNAIERETRRGDFRLYSELSVRQFFLSCHGDEVRPHSVLRAKLEDVLSPLTSSPERTASCDVGMSQETFQKMRRTNVSYTLMSFLVS